MALARSHEGLGEHCEVVAQHLGDKLTTVVQPVTEPPQG